jgi:hypothetical protein
MVKLMYKVITRFSTGQTIRSGALIPFSEVFTKNAL